MGWMRVDTGVGQHRKTYHLARLLNVGRREATGLLHDLWSWAQEGNVPDDGDISDIPSTQLAEAMHWTGTDPEALVTALVASGYLDRSDNHLAIHDWYEWNGRANEKRRKDNQRKRVERGLSADSPQGRPKDNPWTGARKRIRNGTDISSSSDTDGQSADCPQDSLNDEFTPDYLTRCVVALNRGMRENDQLLGYREVPTSTQAGLVDWEKDGIPIDIAEQVVFDVAARYRPAGHNKQPRSLNYFDAAVRERWMLQGQDQESALIERIKEIVRS
jgi:hypothetical protein